MFTVQSSQAQRSLWLAFSAVLIGTVFAGVAAFPGAQGARHGAYASLAVGVWYATLGLAQELKQHWGTAGARAADGMMLRAMVAMAASEGQLAPRELDTIRMVVRVVCGRRVPVARVRRLFEEATTAPSEFSRNLSATRRWATQDAAEAALRSATMLAAVEGPLLDRHAERVLVLANLLRVPRARLALCVRDALRTASHLVRGGDRIA